VTRQWFEDSPVFRKVFDLGIDTSVTDGSNNNLPFRLGDVGRTDFKQLLEVMAAR
jgi:hypothetical protein